MNVAAGTDDLPMSRHVEVDGGVEKRLREAHAVQEVVEEKAETPLGRTTSAVKSKAAAGCILRCTQENALHAHGREVETQDSMENCDRISAPVLQTTFVPGSLGLGLEAPSKVLVLTLVLTRVYGTTVVSCIYSDLRRLLPVPGSS
jgi:hypothetical protein